jgi:hypothetical protein
VPQGIPRASAFTLRLRSGGVSRSGRSLLPRRFSPAAARLRVPNLRARGGRRSLARSQPLPPRLGLHHPPAGKPKRFARKPHYRKLWVMASRPTA